MTVLAYRRGGLSPCYGYAPVASVSLSWIGDIVIGLSTSPLLQGKS